MDTFYHELFDLSEQNPVQVYLHCGNLDYVIQEHWHEALEIDYLRQTPGGCQATVWINGRKQQAEAGSILLINCGDIHALLPEQMELGDQEQVRGLSLFISYEFLLKISPDFDKITFSLSENPARLNELREVLELLIAQQTAPASEYAYMKLHALTLEILYLLFTYFQAEKGDETASGRKYIDRLRKVMAYMEAHHREPLSLQDLAKAFSVSPAYLSKVFKTCTGHTFKSHLNKIRLNHALCDVISTDDTMSDIAMRSGFPDIRSFNTLFKETYGLTPLQYRKKHPYGGLQTGEILEGKPFIRTKEK